MTFVVTESLLDTGVYEIYNTEEENESYLRTEMHQAVSLALKGAINKKTDVSISRDAVIKMDRDFKQQAAEQVLKDIAKEEGLDVDNPSTVLNTATILRLASNGNIDEVVSLVEKAKDISNKIVEGENDGNSK